MSDEAGSLQPERVLVVDDDPHLLGAIENGLAARGYKVVTATTGEEALDLLTTAEVDIILVDLGLPGISGRDVIATVRETSEVPVIVLSVRDAQEDKVAALDAGADDYVTKPFDTPELLARMRAVRRRAAPEKGPSLLSFQGLEIDVERKLVKLNDEVVHLTPTEYRLLETMAAQPGKLLTHDFLLRRVWGPAYGRESHYLRLFVRQLRKKLGDDAAFPRWITTEPGLGYRWLPDQVAKP